MIDSQSRLARQTGGRASQRSAWRIGTLSIAGFLILAGIVFQLAQLGYDGVAVKNLWLLYTIGANVWNFVAARAGAPALGELLRFWPLALVVGGLALLALAGFPRAARLSFCHSEDRES